MAEQLNYPVILAVGIRLGCLNHSLMTAKLIQQQGLKLAGWVANIIEPDMLYLDENIATLTAKIPAPLLGTIPHLNEKDLKNHAKIASYLDLSLIAK